LRVIEVRDLVFDYPGLRALDRVSFVLEPQSITALVGPNGAGKTTLMRCIAALEVPFSGGASIDGRDVQDDPREIHNKIGYLPDFFGLYDQLSVEQCLTYRAGAQAIPANERAAAVRWAVERVELGDRLGQPAGELSRGLRQRLAIAQAIIHRPQVVLLDEPASGLDPEARGRLAQVLLGLREDGMTLLVSSHILAELQDYSSHMLILRDGRLVDHRPVGPSAGAGDDTGTARMVVRLSAADERLGAVLEGAEAVEAVTLDGTWARFAFSGGAEEQRQLLRRLVEAGLPVCGFAMEQENLQETYLARLRQEAP
jgi:ABC-2 type transport system ATP-binding protein